MTKKPIGVSADREDNIKILMNRYCSYLLDQSNKDLEFIISMGVYTYKEALEGGTS